MKKYSKPKMDVWRSECHSVIAVSLYQQSADDSEVLTKECDTWNIWEIDKE